MDKLLIAPSTDPAKTEEERLKYAKQIQAYADLLHCDVMDGEFVERKTISYQDVAKIKENCLLPLDVHLMVKSPEKVVGEYAKSGANIITIHYECFDKKSHLIKVLKCIKKQGCLVGLSLKPNTEVDCISDILQYVDLVLVMSVEPGKSGQAFIESSLDKIKELSILRSQNGMSFLIEVDGGINNENAKMIASCGADILVSGSYVFASDNYQKAIESLR